MLVFGPTLLVLLAVVALHVATKVAGGGSSYRAAEPPAATHTRSSATTAFPTQAGTLIDPMMNAWEGFYQRCEQQLVQLTGEFQASGPSIWTVITMDADQKNVTRSASIAGRLRIPMEPPSSYTAVEVWAPQLNKPYHTYFFRIFETTSAKTVIQPATNPKEQRAHGISATYNPVHSHHGDIKYPDLCSSYVEDWNLTHNSSPKPEDTIVLSSTEATTACRGWLQTLRECPSSRFLCHEPIDRRLRFGSLTVVSVLCVVFHVLEQGNETQTTSASRWTADGTLSKAARRRSSMAAAIHMQPSVCKLVASASPPSRIPSFP